MTRKTDPRARIDVSVGLNIFRAGRHVAMSGETIEFSDSQVAATCAAYDPAKHEAPLVVGHPQHDLPAYGWVSSLAFNEGGIDATPAQVNPDFADMVAAGAFKKISASFYSPNAPQNPVPGVYYLRHVGFLGAQAPAVKGLRNPAFADGEDGVVSFEEFTPTPEQPKKESTVTEEERQALMAENQRLSTELAASTAAGLAAARATVHAANHAFCEGIPANKLTPAMRPVALALMNTLSDQPAVVEFGEGDAKKPLLEEFKKFLQALPEAVSFSEHGTKARAAEGTDTVDFAAPPGFTVDAVALGELGRAKAYQKAHGGDLVAAVNAVRAGQA